MDPHFAANAQHRGGLHAAGPETNSSELIEALRDSGDRDQIEVAKRLWQCQQMRQGRRRGIPSSWARPCRHVACPFCRRVLSRRWHCSASAKMSHADSASCYLVTIMLARSETLEVVRASIKKLRRMLRNLRAGLCRHDPRWRRLELVGLIEIDALGADDHHLLPPRRRKVVENLPLAGRSRPCDSGVVWVPHAHIACHAPGLGMPDLARAFERRWPGEGRVDVEPFHGGDAGENAGRIIAYSSKHKMSLALKDGFKLAWPPFAQAMYWGWLHGLGKGLTPLRITMGPMKSGQPPS